MEGLDDSPAEDFISLTPEEAPEEQGGQDEAAQQQPAADNAEAAAEPAASGAPEFPVAATGGDQDMPPGFGVHAGRGTASAAAEQPLVDAGAAPAEALGPVAQLDGDAPASTAPMNDEVAGVAAAEQAAVLEAAEATAPVAAAALDACCMPAEARADGQEARPANAAPAVDAAAAEPATVAGAAADLDAVLQAEEFAATAVASAAVAAAAEQAETPAAVQEQPGAAVAAEPAAGDNDTKPKHAQAAAPFAGGAREEAAAAALGVPTPDTPAEQLEAAQPAVEAEPAAAAAAQDGAAAVAPAAEPAVVAVAGGAGRSEAAGSVGAAVTDDAAEQAEHGAEAEAQAEAASLPLLVFEDKGESAGAQQKDAAARRSSRDPRRGGSRGSDHGQPAARAEAATAGGKDGDGAAQDAGSSRHKSPRLDSSKERRQQERSGSKDRKRSRRSQSTGASDQAAAQRGGKEAAGKQGAAKRGLEPDQRGWQEHNPHAYRRFRPCEGPQRGEGAAGASRAPRHEQEGWRDSHDRRYASAVQTVKQRFEQRQSEQRDQPDGGRGRGRGYGYDGREAAAGRRRPASRSPERERGGYAGAGYAGGGGRGQYGGQEPRQYSRGEQQSRYGYDDRPTKRPYLPPEPEAPRFGSYAAPAPAVGPPGFDGGMAPLMPGPPVAAVMAAAPAGYGAGGYAGMPMQPAVRMAPADPYAAIPVAAQQQVLLPAGPQFDDRYAAAQRFAAEPAGPPGYSSAFAAPAGYAAVVPTAPAPYAAAAPPAAPGQYQQQEGYGGQAPGRYAEPAEETYSRSGGPPLDRERFDRPGRQPPYEPRQPAFERDQHDRRSGQQRYEQQRPYEQSRGREREPYGERQQAGYREGRHEQQQPYERQGQGRSYREDRPAPPPAGSRGRDERRGGYEDALPPRERDAPRYAPRGGRDEPPPYRGSGGRDRDLAEPPSRGYGGPPPPAGSPYAPGGRGAPPPQAAAPGGQLPRLAVVSGGVPAGPPPEQQAVWFYVDPKGAVQGPHSIAQFRKWLDSLAQRPDLRDDYLAFRNVSVFKQDGSLQVPLLALLG